MILIVTIVFFIFGLIIGSFLNVVIYWMSTARSFGGRSACMSCLKTLRIYELIPLFSFFAQKGRCRNCKTKISIQYPLVELMTGLIFAGLFFKFFAEGGQNIFSVFSPIFIVTYVYYAVMFSLLLVISVYDLRHKIIPDVLSFLFGILAFVGLFFFGHSLLGQTGFYPHVPSILEFLSGILIALPFTLFFLLSKGTWMGLGDAKLALGIGWLLPLQSAFSALTIAFWTGAVIGLYLMIFSKNYGMKSEIPFAPYLVFGTLLVFLFDLQLFPI